MKIKENVYEDARASPRRAAMLAQTRLRAYP